MDNIITLNTNNLRGDNYSATTEVHGGDSSIFFPVSEQPIEVGTNNTERFKAIVREDTGVVLAVHSQDYKLVSNREVFDPIHDYVVNNSNIDTTGMTINDQIGDGGRRVERTYRFPAHTIEIGNNDRTEMQMKMRNSYDGSWILSTMLGGYRLICSNGMVVGFTIDQHRGRHTSGLNPEDIAKRLGGAVDIYMQNEPEWQRWAATHISSTQAMLAIEDFKGMSKRTKETIFQQFEVETESLGHTMWALYNAMTNWSTHTKSRGDTINAVANREAVISKVIASPAFLKLAA